MDYLHCSGNPRQRIFRMQFIGEEHRFLVLSKATEQCPLPVGEGLQSVQAVQCPQAKAKTNQAVVSHAGHRPFQCRYCPYSASQKGNLKTHVLCVHRMPFDNSQYPDRRFKRSRVDSEAAAGNLEEPAAAKAGSSAEVSEEGSKAQE